MSEDLVVAKTVQTSPIRTLAEGLKSMLVEMSLVFDKDGIRICILFRDREAAVAHYGGNHLTVGYIHLAAVGFDI